MDKKKERKLLMDILKTPKKLPKSNNTEIVLSPKSYAQLFKDLGSRANIKIKAKPLNKNQRRKVV